MKNILTFLKLTFLKHTHFLKTFLKIEYKLKVSGNRKKSNFKLFYYYYFSYLKSLSISIEKTITITLQPISNKMRKLSEERLQIRKRFKLGINLLTRFTFSNHCLLEFLAY